MKEMKEEGKTWYRYAIRGYDGKLHAYTPEPEGKILRDLGDRIVVQERLRIVLLYRYRPSIK